MHRFERRGPRIDRIGADIADDVGPQARDNAFLVERQFRIDDFVETLAVGGEVLQAVAGPFDRARQQPRRGTDKNLFRIKRAFGAKAAADIRRHHADALARNAQRHRQRVAHDTRHLRGGLQRQLFAACVVLGDACPRLHRQRGFPTHAKMAADAHCRGGKCFVHIAALELAGDQHVGAGFVVEKWRTGTHRVLRIGHKRQRLVFDGNKLAGIFGLIAARCDDADHRLADIADLAARQRQDRRRVIVRHA